MKIGIITQVRMTSTRLPGKVLKKVKGTSLLKYHIERLKKTGIPVIVATTTNKEDDPIEAFCSHENVHVFRGSETNVLSRFIGAAEKYDLENIIRVTSDCPLIDPSIIMKGADLYLKNSDHSFLYVSNIVKRTFPRGMDFEIFSTSRITQQQNNLLEADDLEHVTPFIWKNKDQKTVFDHIMNDKDKSSYRITVDTSDDFRLVEKLIVQHQAHLKPCHEITAILDSHPELASINAHVEQKKV